VSKDSDRSLARIEIADLLRLAALAAEAEADLFRRRPRGSGRYAGRLLGWALCQGAALHYVNGRNGVKDFGVWSFYAQYDDWPFPPRWRGTRDFGPSKFGRYPGDPPRYSGRRVDFLGRSLPAEPGAGPADVLRRYLAARRTDSAKALAAKAVILIDPQNRACHASRITSSSARSGRPPDVSRCRSRRRAASAATSRSATFTMSFFVSVSGGRAAPAGTEQPGKTRPHCGVRCPQRRNARPADHLVRELRLVPVPDLDTAEHDGAQGTHAVPASARTAAPCQSDLRTGPAGQTGPDRTTRTGRRIRK
jgi:hypothetical protein